MTTTDDSVEIRVGTAGRSFPYMETKVVDAETGAELGPNMQGEFCVRGYNIMKGYYKMEDATRAAIDPEGWLHTGDLAEVDEAGYYKITGRIKDMIIRAGENISPKEVEDVIYKLDGVKDVAVVAAPSYKFGEEVCAVVVAKDGAGLKPEDIQVHVNKNLAKHKVPKYVVFTDQLPLTASGKIQKYKLRDLVKDQLGLEENA